MDLPNVRILAVAPYEGMKTAIANAAEAFPNVQLDVCTGDLEEGAMVVRQRKDRNYDAIISRGGTAEMIRRDADCPVVEIRITFYDILRAIKLAENYNKRFAIVGFPAITETAHILCDLMRYTFRIVTVHSMQEIEPVLSRLRQERCQLVLCDMAAHTAARQMGFEAFLITSGAESLRDALTQAAAQGGAFHQARQERLLLRSLIPHQNQYTLVLHEDGSPCVAMPEIFPEDLLSSCKEKLPELLHASQIHFFHNIRGMLHAVMGHVAMIEDTRFLVFTCQPTQLPLRSGVTGIRSLRKPECEQLFMNSFYSLSGAMGELEHHLNAIAVSHQPVMIMGEPGTGKEQIARALYLRGKQTNHPFVVIDCRVMEDKSWDFLFSHHNSPLNAVGSTLYFQHLQEITAPRQSELLSIILETGLVKRNRLIFACSCLENSPIPTPASHLSARLGCISITLPTLRSRSDEIPSLAILYLNSLNMELGRQISGFDPSAMEQLQLYDWPNNYTQFKQVLHELATLTSSAYIHSDIVAELLTRERAMTRSVGAVTGGIPISGQSLDQITSEVIRRVLAEHNGNQTSAARQLGISRSTLWRYLRTLQNTVRKPK